MPIIRQMQCDQNVAELFVKCLAVHSKETLPRSKKCFQSRLKFCAILNKPSKIAKYFKIPPKWRNFVTLIGWLMTFGTTKNSSWSWQSQQRQSTSFQQRSVVILFTNFKVYLKSNFTIMLKYFLQLGQCDQIWQFIGLWASF